MTLSQRIKSVRKNISKRLSRAFATRKANEREKWDRDIVRTILICRPNAQLGNLLLLTPLVQEVGLIFPDARIDLFTGGRAASEIFLNYGQARRIMELPPRPFFNLLRYIRVWFRLGACRYDVVINAVQDSSSGRLATILARGRYKFFGDVSDYYKFTASDYSHAGKSPVYNFRGFLNRMACSDGGREIPPLDLKLDAEELSRGKAELMQIVDMGRPTIALFTHASGNKRYKEEWWESFYTALSQDFPGYNFVEVLPIDGYSRLGHWLPAFYSDQLRLLGAFIANCAFFIGADSGVMHLSSSAGIPTIGLFKSSRMVAYAPYNRFSLGIDTRNIQWYELMAEVKLAIIWAGV